MLERLQDIWDDAVERWGRHVGTLALCCLLIVGILVFVAVPRTAFGDAIGLTAAQTRVQAFGKALFWSARSATQQEEAQTPQVVYGSLDKLDDKGNRLLVDLPLGEKWEKRTYLIADLIITNRAAAQAYFASLPTRNARLEVYYGTHVVGYVQGQPVNIGLIDAGAAMVNPRPPSNLVSRAYASYYWSVVRGVAPTE